MMEKLTVGLGTRSYDILIGGGLLAEAGAHIRPLLPRPYTVIVTDENVAGLHLATLQAGLAVEGIESEAIVLTPGESTKNMGALGHVVERLLDLKIERDDLVIAFGGGVIGDLAGFAASVLRRGVDFIQVPTTLLAQVDSSVGGKTGVNAPQGKNLIGAFHQPKLVLADIDVLGTLTPRDFLAGYGEVAKYGLLGDEAFFGWLEVNAPAMAAGD
ncbi:MAG: 3-dehydroquinate synthase, partial [Paracoccaceae bacterium]